METKAKKAELLNWLENVEDKDILLQVEALKNSGRKYGSRDGEKKNHTLEEPKATSIRLMKKSWGDRITIDPKICNGKPTIRGKRIAVQTILEFLSAGDSKETILEQYPSLETEDIKACLKFASSLMENNYEIKPLYG